MAGQPFVLLLMAVPRVVSIVLGTEEDFTDFGTGGKCHQCKNDITKEIFKTAGKKLFHEECLQCSECGEVLVEEEVRICKNKIFCPDCRKKARSTTNCDRCEKPLDRKEKIRLRPHGEDSKVLSVHPKCFVCQQCKKQLNKAATLMTWEGKIFCSARCCLQVPEA